MGRRSSTKGALFDLLFAGVVAGLIYRDLALRYRRAVEVRALKRRLEAEADRQTRDLVDLSTHLQSVSEREKANLARELHDELGGLLVGARMDISWAEHRLVANDVDLKARLNRVQQNLSSGIDLKRRIIEQLRPTLLDNVGFLAALRWHFRETCGRAGLTCTELFPGEEPKFSADAAIALFRVAQEAFANIIQHAGAKAVGISLDIDDDMVVFRINDDGRGITEAELASGARGVASMRHRVRALGGTLDVLGSASGGTKLVAWLPASSALCTVGQPDVL